MGLASENVLCFPAVLFSFIHLIVLLVPGSFLRSSSHRDVISRDDYVKTLQTKQQKLLVRHSPEALTLGTAEPLGLEGPRPVQLGQCPPK